jgi:DnaK suppressor protein
MPRTRAEIADVSVGSKRPGVRRMLLERREQLQNEIQNRVRELRELGASGHRHPSELRDTVDVEPEDDLVFALIQMKADMLEKVDEAVRRCDDGTYGYCGDCGEVIGMSRLSAMPFAIRCKDCEEMREYMQHRGRVQARRVMTAVGASV